MGDAGSQLLGYLLAAAALMQNIGSASGLSLAVAGPLLILAVPLFDTLSAAGPMTVLGFRQFLLNPNQGDVNLTPTDTDARFNALYIGNPVPLKQGSMSGGCALASGPGKTVLHR